MLPLNTIIMDIRVSSDKGRGSGSGDFKDQGSGSSPVHEFGSRCDENKIVFLKNVPKFIPYHPDPFFS